VAAELTRVKAKYGNAALVAAREPDVANWEELQPDRLTVES